MGAGGDDFRASDAEREAVANRLRDAAAEGRLDPDELEERLAAVYAARTQGELAAATRDLPVPVAPVPPPPSRWASEAVRRRAAGFVSVNLVCIAVWFATGADSSFWPGWVLLASGIGMIGMVVRLIFGIEEPDRSDREQRRIERRERHLERRGLGR